MSDFPRELYGAAAVEIARLRRALADSDRAAQANGQALLDERAAHRHDAVIAVPAHAYCESAGPFASGPEWNALLAAHRATTPSSAPATHVVVAVAERDALREIADAAAVLQQVGGDDLRRMIPAAMGNLDRALDAYPGSAS